MGCRYFLSSSLPPTASAVQVAHLQQAVRTGQVLLQGLAERYVRLFWKTTLDVVVDAISRHMATGCGVYAKYEAGSSRIIPHKIQINLRLDDETGEDSDIYVELTLAAGGRVYIRNAHPHGNAPRLPR